jgi:lipoate-protein ligase A
MTDLADREWRLVRETARDGPMHMALDEVAAETAADGGPRTVRVYRWEPSTLSLGYHQDPETIDWEYCEREGITVTRRPTGGGAIYHDNYGDISYSIVAPADELPGDLMDTYELLCQPLFDALEGIGIDAGFAETERPPVHEPACYLRALHPAHDVVAADGRKLSGNAQYRRRDSVIQHGSITYASDAGRQLAPFATDEVTPAAFRERVTAIDEHADIDRAGAVAALEDALATWTDADQGGWTDADQGGWTDADQGGWTDAELARARERAREKYEAEAWTRNRVEPD